MRQRIMIGLLAAIALVAVAIGAALGRAGGVARGEIFSNPIMVGIAGQLNASTRGASTQPGEPGVRSGDRTVWFSWTPAATAPAYAVSTGAQLPLTVRVYTGTALGRLARVDRPDTGGVGVLAQVDAVAGTTYRIQVDSGRARERFRLRIVQAFGLALPSAKLPTPTSTVAAQSLGIAIVAAVERRRRSEGQLRWTTEPHGFIDLTWTAPPGSGGAFTVSLARISPGSRLTLALNDGRHTRGRVTIMVHPGHRYVLRVAGRNAYFGLKIRLLRGFKLDLTPPVIRCSRPRGWSDSNRAVVCHAFDPGSGLAHPSQRRFVLATAVAPGTATADAMTGTVEVCDRAGNCAAAGPITGIRVDRGRPIVTCSHASSTSFKALVVVDCTAVDPAGGSGLAQAADAHFTLTATLPAGRISRSVPFSHHGPICDRAGNCTRVPNPGRVAIDRALPAISCHAPRRRAWLRIVRISCAASSRHGALASQADSAFTLTAPLGSQTVPAHTVCTALGNCRTVGPFGPFRIDQVPPAFHCAVSRGWLRGRRARIRCVARDGQSGVAGARRFWLAAALSHSAEGVTETATRRLCDRVGNCTTVGPFSVRLDAAPPRIQCPSAPLGTFYAPLTLDCSVTDYGSGVRGGRTIVTIVAAGHPGRLVAKAGFTHVRVCDNAGNCAWTPTLRGIRIDRRRQH